MTNPLARRGHRARAMRDFERFAAQRDATRDPPPYEHGLVCHANGHSQRVPIEVYQELLKEAFFWDDQGL